MIALLRVFAVAIFAIVMFIGGCGYCLLSPPETLSTFSLLAACLQDVSCIWD